MTLCKFFQEGGCKKGDSCQFEHTYYNQSSPSSRYGNFTLRSSALGGTNSYGLGNPTVTEYRNRFSLFNQDQNSSVRVDQKKKNDKEAREIELLAQEIDQWEKSGYWILSCIAPFQDRGCLPGLQDYSPEEVRWEAYQAEKQGSSAVYKQMLQKLVQEAQSARNSLKNPTPEVKDMLMKILNQPMTTSTTPAFFSISNKSDFADVLASNEARSFGTSIFGGSSSGQGQMANSGSNFHFSLGHIQNSGNSASFAGNTTLFGRSTSQGQGTSIFGGGSATLTASSGSAPFGTSSTNQNLFGKSSFGNTSTQPGPFSLSGSVSSNQNIFGGSTGKDNTQPFGGQPQSTSQSVFGPAGIGSNNIFSSADGTSNQLKPFSNTSIFGGSASSTVVTTSETKTTVGGQRVYTPLDSLTNSEKEQFLAQTFTLGKIPMRPPPQELCM